MLEKHKVMFFLPHLGGGGAEMNAVRLSVALDKFNFTSSFATCRGSGSYEKFLLPQTRIDVLSTGQMRSSTLGLIGSIPPLRKLIQEQSPSILCPVMYGPSLSALTAVAKLTPKPKVVLSIQNSIKGELLYTKNIRSQITLSLIKAIYPQADLVVSLSRGVADEILELVPSLKNRVVVIPNTGPVAAPVQTKVEIKRPSEGKLIVACGRLVEQKGYPYLLKAFSSVLEVENAHLWILGVGPLKEELENLSQSLNIDHRVRFLGFQDDPLAYMGAADIFVLSSLWEGFGNVIIEAMGMGTPVVATDCPHGPGEIIHNDINGILVPPANEEYLANALIRLLRDDNLRERLSVEAYRRATDFSPDKIASQYADAFHTVLDT